LAWWKRKKCPLCKSVIKPKHKVSEVRIDTADGPLELEVCPKCAYILDKTADILMEKPRDVPVRTKQEDHSSSEEAD
jgi:ribosome-binding protein aMBF1 (putative translation factor)